MLFLFPSTPAVNTGEALALLFLQQNMCKPGENAIIQVSYLSFYENSRTLNYVHQTFHSNND